MTREGHVRICEGLGGKFPRSTRRVLPEGLTKVQNIIMRGSLFRQGGTLIEPDKVRKELPELP